MIHTERFTPIQDVLDIYDPNRLWYNIPNFNGYEISNDNYIRSMKHYMKYPYGILIKPVKRKPYGNSPDPLYELSDDNNKRQRIRLSQIVLLASQNQFAALGYPRRTIITNTSGRNKFVKNKDGAYVKVYNGPGVRNSMNIPPMDNTTHYAKFTIIQDGSENMNSTYQEPMVHVPVTSIDGSTYYGRQDARVICDVNVNI